VNYIAVEKEPSEEELRREREEEDEVFAGVARFDELLERLRGVDVARGDRVEDSREIEVSRSFFFNLVRVEERRWKGGEGTTFSSSS